MDEYNGELSDGGLRQGIGNCKWPDGSYYEGDWVNNLRDGNGKFIEDGITYVGQWQQDLKHGRGMITYKNGIVIIGIWVQDQLNGLASVQKSEGEEKKFVIFKDGMQINLDKEPLRIWTILFSVTIMLAFYIGIALGFIIGP